MSQHEKTVKIINQAAPSGFVLFLGYIGAAVYFVDKTSGGFWEVIGALLQAIVWPTYLVFHVLKVLGV